MHFVSLDVFISALVDSCDCVDRHACASSPSRQCSLVHRLQPWVGLHQSLPDQELTLSISYTVMSLFVPLATLSFVFLFLGGQSKVDYARICVSTACRPCKQLLTNVTGGRLHLWRHRGAHALLCILSSQFRRQVQYRFHGGINSHCLRRVHHRSTLLLQMA